VAGVGNEVDPHRLEPARRGEVAKEQDDALARRPVRSQRADQHLEAAFGRDPLRIFDRQGLSAPEHLVDPVQHDGAAQREGQRTRELQPRQELAGGPVRLDDRPAPVDQDHGIRDGREQRIGDAAGGRFRAGLPVAPEIPPVATPGRDRDQRHCREGSREQPAVQAVARPGHCQDGATRPGAAQSGCAERRSRGIALAFRCGIVAHRVRWSVLSHKGDRSRRNVQPSKRLPISRKGERA
jgi:hypothetical protein